MASARLAGILIVFIGAVACSDGRSSVADAAITVDSGTAGDAGAGAVDAGEDAGPALPFALESAAFAEGERIPLRHECGPPLIADGPGQNITPPLSWTAGPPETLSYALVVRDLDAGSLVHWVLYDIDPMLRAIDEGVRSGYAPSVPDGAKQAEIQMSGYFGYLGPCSDGRINTYQWTLHALDTATLPGVARTTTENAIATAIEAASIASASLTGES